MEWTPEGVREYNTSNPLVVELGDRILIRCPSEGNYTFSNLWIQNHKRQYDECNCMAVPDENCDFMVAKNGQCILNVVNPVVSIRQNDAELNSVLNFKPGRLYYFTSYAPEQDLAGAYSEASMGGQCLDGLRMVIEVKELPTQPTTSETVEVSTGSTEISGSSEVPSTGGGTASRTGSTNIVSTEPSTDPITGTKYSIDEIILLPSRQLRDWHVVIIVVFGVSILALIVILVVGTVGMMLYKRRSLLAVNPEVDSIAKEEECPLEMVEASPDQSAVNPEVDSTEREERLKLGIYPTEKFDDPVDRMWS